MPYSEDRTSFRSKSVLYSLLAALVMLALIYVFYRGGLPWLIAPERKVVEALLIAVFSSLVISAFLDFAFKQQFIDVVSAQTREAISSVINEQSNIQAHGLRNVHKGLPYDTFLVKLKSAKNAIILNTFIPDTPSLLDEIREMTASGGLIRILVLDPCSKMVEVRAKSLNRSIEYVREGILTCLEDLSETASAVNSQNNIEVRVYDTFPSVSLYKADDMMFIGHYVLGVHAVEGPQLELSEDKYYSQIMLAHFDKLWESANDFDISKQRNRGK